MFTDTEELKQSDSQFDVEEWAKWKAQDEDPERCRGTAFSPRFHRCHKKARNGKATCWQHRDQEMNFYPSYPPTDDEILRES